MPKKKIPDLQFEIIQQPSNLLYLTVIEYKRENFLTVVDNITEDEVIAFVLDVAEQEGITLQQFLSIANRWYYSDSKNHPLSIEFAKHGLTPTVAPMIKSFDLNCVSRIIGYPFVYKLLMKRVKRRRVVQIPDTIEIRLKSAKQD